jgi:glycosyltransferase involved in cell wall biosynthesis
MIARRKDLLRLVRANGVDVVLTQGLGTLDFLVMTLRWRTRTQVWWTIQNSRFTLRREHLTRHRWLLGAKRFAHRWLYRLGSGLVDGVIAVSDDTARSFAEETGTPAERIHVVCNAVDVETFVGVREKPATRARLGFEDGDHLMIAVATFKPQKGHRVLVEAVDAVARRVPRLHVLLVGDGELAGSISAEIATRGLAGRIHMLGTRRDVADLLAASDSFVLPSLWEGLPVALVEAMASGLPVVATAVSGTSQVVDQGVTGWLVPAGDAAALAEAIAQLVSDPARAAAIGAAGRAHVTRVFGAAAQAERLVELFRRADPRARDDTVDPRTILTGPTP